MKNQQGSGTITAIIIVVLIAIIGLWVMGDKNSDDAVRDGAEVVETEEAEVEAVVETEVDTEADVDVDGSREETGDDNALEAPVEAEQAAATGSYTDYREGVLAEGPESQVLFFHASWCPSCRTLEKNILEEKTLPDGVAIYKIDYDSAGDLRAKYKVTTQHTLVQVDNEGNLIKKWSGGNNTASIVSKIEA